MKILYHRMKGIIRGKDTSEESGESRITSHYPSEVLIFSSHAAFA
jgi:hypothetical protein